MKTHGQVGVDGPALSSAQSAAREGSGSARDAHELLRQDPAWLKLLPLTAPALPLATEASSARTVGAGATAGDVDSHEQHDLSTCGASSGQLLAAAHTIAAYLGTGTQRVLDAASEALAPGGASTVTIRLGYVTPEGGHAAVELQHPDLGNVALEVSLNGRTLSVLATAENERAGAAIREGQAALALRLEAQGITLHALDVVVLRRRGRTPERKTKR